MDGVDEVDVVVLGAGPAGAMTGLTVARAGRSVEVVEAGIAVGGMAASVTVAGQRVDLGSHRLHRTIAPDLLAELRDLLGAELQPRPRGGRIRLGERWVDFPLRPLDLLRHAPPRLALGVLRDALTSPLRRAHADTFAEQVRCGPGPTLLAEFYAPYARKLWAADADRLDGELFRRRVSAGSIAAIVRRTLRRTPGDEVGFWYPAGGFGRITEVLVDAMVSAGGAVALSSPVTRLDRGDGHWVVTAGGRRRRARIVVSTVPNTALVAAIDGVPDTVVAAATGLRHRGGLVVHLVVPRPSYSAFDAHYFPGLDVRIARLSEPKRYRDGADPVDRTVLCAELPADPGDGVWDLDDAAIGELVRTDLLACGLPDPAHVAAHVTRLAHVYPCYDLGTADRQATVEAWAATQPGLVLVGRQALFAHDNTHHALEMGRAAGRYAAGLIDTAGWMQAREHFRRHVVED